MKFSKGAPVKIIILGAGGTGGYVLQHVYRLAYASQRKVRVIVCDGDKVELPNLIRQNFIMQDVGANKASVLSARYSSAFGIETEYIPDFVESTEQLNDLVYPDITRSREPQNVILIGAVDNNKSRQLCHEVFYQSKDLIYIDSGNGETNGQVVCGVRKNNRTVFKPVCGIYPDMLKDEDKFPSELSCGERSVSEPQTIMANLTASTVVLAFLYSLLIDGEIKTRYVTFSSKLMAMRPTAVQTSKKLTRKKTKPAALAA